MAMVRTSVVPMIWSSVFVKSLCAWTPPLSAAAADRRMNAGLASSMTTTGTRWVRRAIADKRR